MQMPIISKPLSRDLPVASVTGDVRARRRRVGGLVHRSSLRNATRAVWRHATGGGRRIQAESRRTRRPQSAVTHFACLATIIYYRRIVQDDRQRPPVQ